MNEDIKEILDYFKEDVQYLEEELKNSNFLGRYITIRDKECGYLKKLLDYITNLQQANKKLKEDFKILKTLQMNTNNILNELEKYYKEQLEFIVELPVYTKDIAQEHKVMELCYEDFLNKIQELKEKYK